MVAAMREMLVTAGVDEDDIRTEEFDGYLGTSEVASRTSRRAIIRACSPPNNAYMGARLGKTGSSDHLFNWPFGEGHFWT
jgi:hypothetical protein